MTIRRRSERPRMMMMISLERKMTMMIEKTNERRLKMKMNLQERNERMTMMMFLKRNLVKRNQKLS